MPRRHSPPFETRLAMILKHDDVTLGEITSRAGAEAIRDSMRGREFRFGIASNALDFALSGDERHLVYLSPRDRRNAEALAKEIVDAITPPTSHFLT